jgi:tetratricopeptide (TPR) repeat protein
LQSAGKWKLAIDDWNRTIELRPNWLDAYVMRGKAQQEVAEFGAARADFEHAVRLDARSVEASNALAYFLTTCADERFRDYQRGISMATTSCQLSNWKDFRHLAMLATANGQAGQFAEAVRWQSAAIALAPDDQIRTMRERLDHFKSGAPTDSSRHP